MDTYDFIIVGAGASGCLLASRLAHALKGDQILLIEAGGENSSTKYQGFGDRNFTLATAPGYNWGYKTVPQENLEGREIDQSRGKGLGGSTAINFCVWTRGPRSDYERWAHLIGDDTWSWPVVNQRYKKIERVANPPDGYGEYVNFGSKASESHGKVDVGFPDGWDPEFGTYLKGVYHDGYPVALDINNGNPIGLGVMQHSISKRYRVTAASAFLLDRSSNLTIMTGKVVERVINDGQKITGVALSERTISARKEVIISAGPIDSPKILHLSGIGPAAELDKLGIQCIKDLPAIGKNLHDRLFLELVTVRKPGTAHRTSYLMSSPEAFEEARRQWMKDQTGPLSDFHLPQMIGYLKSKAVGESKELEMLEPEVREAIKSDTSPDLELISHIGSPSVSTPEQYIAMATACMNLQSRGSITLRSKNPADTPIVDPNFLHEDFDKRVAIEAVREAMTFLECPTLKESHVRFAAEPESMSDEDILVKTAFVRKTAVSMWHTCGTVAMGRPGSPDTCIDPEFRVLGLKGLRVVDMSVAPFLPSAHTQAMAYLVGQTAAEKIIEEYTGL
ncbi:MAG: hypothetical protein Q9181_007933 [Wetmoreana brouardii]